MATRRQPALAKGEKAAVTNAARTLAKKLNEKDDRIKELEIALGNEARRKRALERAKQRRTRDNRAQIEKRRVARRGDPDKAKCHGLNGLGKPCGQSPLLPERWDGPEEITGLYCLHHEPSIDRESRRSFQLTGSSQKTVYRRVTPGEVAHDLMQVAPHEFLRPYLRALGLELDPETNEFRRVSKGLVLHGFSRGGTVVRSSYTDLAGQVQIVEKLLDRVYGKSRQAIDLASMNTTVSVNIHMDVDRVTTVASVLAQAGALPNGNGEVIEGTATDVETDDLS